MRENETAQPSSETKRYRSLSAKLLLIFACFAFVFVVIVIAVQLLMEYSRETRHMREHLVYVEEAYGSIIAENAYDLDRRALEMNLDAILRFREIESVEVRERSSSGEESLAEAGDPGASSEVGRVFFVPYAESVDGGPDGVNVELRASTGSLVARLWNSAYIYLLVGLLFVAVFASGMFSIISKSVIRPVVKFAEYARALNVDSLGESEHFDLPRGPLHRRRDELDTLRDAFIGLQDRLRRQVSERDKANELYRALFENTHATMLAIDPDNGKIVRANAAAEKFYGWTRHQLSGMSIQEINTLSPQEVKASMHSLREAGEGYLEFRHRLSDGSTRDVAVHSGIAVVDGESVLHSVIFDISGRKAAERERDLMAFGMDRSALGVMRIREDDAVVESANAKACDLLGYSREELVGMQVYDFDPTSMNPDTWVGHRRKVRHEGQYQFETSHRRSNGTEYPAEVTVAYIEYGGREYSFSFFQDISDRKDAEERLIRSLREKEVLLREVHHRVRNNLAVMSSLINLQTSTIQNVDDARNAVEKIRDRIRAMSLAYSAVDESNDLSRINLAHYSEELAVYLQGEYALEKPVVVTVDSSEVWADLTNAIPFGLILNELVTNSLKHAFGGEGERKVSITVSRKEGAIVEAVVADNGTGIPEDILHANEKPLGLMLIDILAEQLGGSVTYDVSRGTEATVTFPVSEMELPNV